MMRLTGVAGLALALVACGSAEESSPEPTPTDFSIQAADLYREMPVDVCRSKNPEFLTLLMTRAMQALPPDLAGTEKFEDFNIHPAMPGPGTEAVLRLKAGTDQKMYSASGKFDPATCSMTGMRVGVGVHPTDPRWKQIGEVQ